MSPSISAPSLSSPSCVSTLSKQWRCLNASLFSLAPVPRPPGLPVPEVYTLKPLEFGKPNTLVCFISNLFPPTLTVTWQHHFVPVEGASPTYISAIDGLTFQAFSYLNFTPEPFDLYSCVVTHEIDSYTPIAHWGEALSPEVWSLGWEGSSPWEGLLLLGHLQFSHRSFPASVLPCCSPSPSGQSAPRAGLQADLTPFALVPQNPLPSELLENVLCGVAFGLGVLGIVMGIAFFIWSRKPCSVGKSFGKAREPGTRMPVWVCQDSPPLWGAFSDTQALGCRGLCAA